MRSLVCAALVLSLGRSAHADEPARLNAVTTNPVRFGILHFQVEYERAVGSRFSAFVAPIVFYHAEWYPFAHEHGVTALGGGIDVGARWYVTGSALDGIYVGPLFSAYHGEVSHHGETMLSGYVFSPGAQVGYAKLLGRWELAGGLGGSYGFATDEAPEGSPRAEQLPHWGPWLNFRLNAGVAF